MRWANIPPQSSLPPVCRSVCLCGGALSGGTRVPRRSPRPLSCRPPEGLLGQQIPGSIPQADEGGR